LKDISSNQIYNQIKKSIIDKIKRILIKKKFDVNKVENSPNKKELIKIIKKILSKEKEKEIRNILTEIDNCDNVNFTRKISISGPDDKSRDFVFEIEDLKRQYLINDNLSNKTLRELSKNENSKFKNITKIIINKTLKKIEDLKRKISKYENVFSNKSFNEVWKHENFKKKNITKIIIKKTLKKIEDLKKQISKYENNIFNHNLIEENRIYNQTSNEENNNKNQTLNEENNNSNQASNEDRKKENLAKKNMTKIMINKNLKKIEDLKKQISKYENINSNKTLREILYKEKFTTKNKIKNKNYKKIEKLKRQISKYENIISNKTLREILYKKNFTSLNKIKSKNFTFLRDCDTGMIASFIPIGIDDKCKDIVIKKVKKIDEKLQIKFSHLQNFTDCLNITNRIKSINGPSQKTDDIYYQDSIKGDKIKTDSRNIINDNLNFKINLEENCQDKIVRKKYKRKMEKLIDNLYQNIKVIKREKDIINETSNSTQYFNNQTNNTIKKNSCDNIKYLISRNPIRGPDENSFDISNDIHNIIKFQGSPKFTDEIENLKERIKRKIINRKNKTQKLNKNLSEIINEKLTKLAEVKIKTSIKRTCRDKINKNGKGVKIQNTKNIRIPDKIKDLCFIKKHNNFTNKEDLSLRELNSINNPAIKKICKKFISKYIPLNPINEEEIEKNCINNSTDFNKGIKPISGPNENSNDIQTDKSTFLKEKISSVEMQIKQIKKEIRKIKDIKRFYNTTSKVKNYRNSNKPFFNKLELKQIKSYQNQIRKIIKKLKIVSEIENQKTRATEVKRKNRNKDLKKISKTTTLKKFSKFIKKSLEKTEMLIKKIRDLKKQGQIGTKKMLIKFTKKKINFYKFKILKFIKKIKKIVKKNKEKALEKSLNNSLIKKQLSIKYAKKIKNFKKILKKDLKNLKLLKQNLKQEIQSCMKYAEKDIEETIKKSILNNKVTQNSKDFFIDQETQTGNKYDNYIKKGEELIFNASCFNTTLANQKPINGPSELNDDFIAGEEKPYSNKTSILSNCKDKFITKKEKERKELKELDKILKEDCPEKDDCDKLPAPKQVNGINYKSEDIVKTKEIIKKEQKYIRLCLNKKTSKRLINFYFGKNSSNSKIKKSQKRSFRNGPSYKTEDIIINPVNEKLDLLKKLKRRRLCEKLRVELKFMKNNKKIDSKNSESIVKLEKELEKKEIKAIKIPKILRMSKKSQIKVKEIQQRLLKEKCFKFKNKFSYDAEKLNYLIKSVKNGPNVISDDVVLTKEKMGLLKKCVREGYISESDIA